MFNNSISYNNKSIIVFISISVLSFSTALSILYLPTKYIFVLLFLPFIIIFWFTSSLVAKIALNLFIITFPITLQFMGRDALTTGTLLIFLLFIWNMTTLKSQQRYNKNTKNVCNITAILVLIAIIGVTTKTPSGYYGTAIRHFINFYSSVIIFMIVIQTAYLKEIENNYEEYIEKILSLLILICTLHILLSILLYIYPNIQYIFKIFFHRTQTHLGNHISKNGGFERATSIFTGGEELGELLAILTPFYFYKAFKNNKFVLLLPILFIGLMISGTRSAAILAIIESIVFFLFTRSNKFLVKKLVIVAFVLFFLVIGWNFISSIIGILINRFHESSMNIRNEAEFSTIMNRGPIWEAAWDTTWRTFSLLGHGPIQASALGMNGGMPNFHCLYLSLLFQYGIIGFFIFIRFFIFLYQSLILKLRQLDKEHSFYPLVLANILSLTAFLINEGKYEFNRGDSYQQFMFVIFAIYFLTGQITQKHNSI